MAAGMGMAGPEEAFQYYRARYYDPKIGRFISEDPIGFDGGVNFYAYAGGNPVVWRDPFGLDVTVSYYEGGSLNPYGHIALAVNKDEARGFYPIDPNAPGLYFGETQPGVVDVETAKAARTITIRTTPQQDQLIRELLDALEDIPGKYNARTRNCAQVPAAILRRAGIPVPRTIKTPGELMKWLYAEYGPKKSRLPLDPHVAH